MLLKRSERRRSKKGGDVRQGVAVRIFTRDGKHGGPFRRRTAEELYAAATAIVERRVPLTRRGVETEGR
jgi:hypothetical protein